MRLATKEEIKELKQAMKERKWVMYIVPTNTISLTNDPRIPPEMKDLFVLLGEL